LLAEAVAPHCECAHRRPLGGMGMPLKGRAFQTGGRRKNVEDRRQDIGTAGLTAGL